MAVYIYANGKYHILAGNKIVKDAALLDMKDADKIIADGEAYRLGNATVTPVTPDIPDDPDIPSFEITHDNGTEPASGTVWYITPDGAGQKTGTSWSDAASGSMVHAIIQSASSGDRVYFSEGEYISDYPITLPAGVSLYGGFKLNNPSWESRNAFTNQTIWTPSYNGKWLEENNTVEGQIVDGFYIDGYKVTTVNTSNLLFRNMYVLNGAFLTKGDAENSEFNNCNINIHNADKVRVIGTSSSAVFNELDNAFIALGGGVLTVGQLSNTYISGSTVNAASINNVRIYNSELLNCIVSGPVNDMEAYKVNVSATDAEALDSHFGNIELSGSATNCNIYGNATIGGSATNCFISGDVEIEGNASQCVLKNAFVLGEAENCVFAGKYKESYTPQVPGYENYVFDKLVGTIFSEYDTPKKANIVSCSDLSSDFIISNDDLYQITGTNVAALGFGSANIKLGCVGTYKGLFIGANRLYRISTGSLPAVQAIQSTTTGWTKVGGTDVNTGDYTSMYAIRGGELFWIRHSDNYPMAMSEQETGWTDIGVIGSTTYGICNGKLYSLNQKERTQIGTETDWTAVGNCIGNLHYSIRNGKLYNFDDFTQVGTETGWTHVVSSKSDTLYAWGIRDGKLYTIRNNLVYLQSVDGAVDGGWTHLIFNRSQESAPIKTP